MMSLPRQARDKHRESTQKIDRFLAGGQSMAVFTSDDDGKTYKTSTGDGPSVHMPFKGLAECQIAELNNGSVVVNAR